MSYGFMQGLGLFEQRNTFFFCWKHRRPTLTVQKLTSFAKELQQSLLTELITRIVFFLTDSLQNAQ